MSVLQDNCKHIYGYDVEVWYGVYYGLTEINQDTKSHLEARFDYCPKCGERLKDGGKE